MAVFGAHSDAFARNRIVSTVFLLSGFGTRIIIWRSVE